MPPYRPSDPAPLTFSLGQWQAGPLPLLDAAIRVDPRLFAWLVNKAAPKIFGVYELNMGHPPVRITVTY